MWRGAFTDVSNVEGDKVDLTGVTVTTTVATHSDGHILIPQTGYGRHMEDFF